jgi:uncharacterized membrane protein YedE/YeeE
MKWVLRLLGWTACLTWAAWKVGDLYKTQLARLATAALSKLGIGFRVERLDILAPEGMALFAALCLASYWLPWRKRLVFVVWGLLITFCLDLLVLVPAVLSWLLEGYGRLPAVLVNLRASIFGTLPWACAVALWMVMAGGSVPLLRAAAPRSENKGVTAASSRGG